MEPIFRPGLGDDTGRYIRSQYGYVEYRYTPGRLVEIVNIEVEAEHRGKGHGRELIRLLFKEVKKNADAVYVLTSAMNEIAQQFYENCLFNNVTPLRRFYNVAGRGVDAILYHRAVRGPI